MRDLSNARSSGSRDIPLKKYWRFFGLVVIVLIVLVVVRFGLNASGAVGGSSVVLREAPRSLTPVDLDGSESLSGEGVELTTQSASFTDVKYGGEARATATRSFGGGTYVLKVNATLPDPVNTNYQVWLVGGGEAVPVNFMSGSKTSWSLSLRDRDIYSDYDEIWITLERTKDDLPEEHILEGAF